MIFIRITSTYISVYQCIYVCVICYFFYHYLIPIDPSKHLKRGSAHFWFLFENRLGAFLVPTNLSLFDRSNTCHFTNGELTDVQVFAGNDLPNQVLNERRLFDTEWINKIISMYPACNDLQNTITAISNIMVFSTFCMHNIIFCKYNKSSF